MSVSIGWKKKDPNELNYISGGSNFHNVLENVFGTFPTELNESCLERLTVIAACDFDGANDLIDAIHKYGCIVVDARW